MKFSNIIGENSILTNYLFILCYFNISIINYYNSLVLSLLFFELNHEIKRTSFYNIQSYNISTLKYWNEQKSQELEQL